MHKWNRPKMSLFEFDFPKLKSQKKERGEIESKWPVIQIQFRTQWIPM